MAPKLRLLIVDDHPTFRVRLVVLIHSQPDLTVQAEVDTGEEAIERYRQDLADVVLMDFGLPGIGGTF